LIPLARQNQFHGFTGSPNGCHPLRAKEMSGFPNEVFEALSASNVPLPHEDRLLDVKNGFGKWF